MIFFTKNSNLKKKIMGGEREGVDGPTEQAQTNLLLQLSYGPDKLNL